MPDKHPRIIKNLRNRPCQRCRGIHDYISRPSEHAKCGTPVAFSKSKAETLARLQAGTIDAVELVPNDTIVILDDSARKLPQTSPHVPLDQDVPGTLSMAG